MIVTQTSQAVYPQPAPVPPPPAAEPVAADNAEPSAVSGSRGIALLSGQTAAVLIAQQGDTGAQPAAPDASPAALDLKGRDLRQEDLSKLDLRGADLTGADLTGKDLTGLDLTGAKLVNAKLDNTNLTDAKLNMVDATGASFTGALIARTGMDNATFSKAKFNDAWFGGTADAPTLTGDDARLQGKSMMVQSSNFEGADFSGSTAKYGIVFKDSNMDDTSFEGVKSDRLINGSTFTSAFGFNHSSVKGASFKGASAILGGAYSDFTSADFSDTTGETIQISGSKLDNASFAGSSSRLVFGYTDLRSTNLAVKNHDLSNSSFNNANLAGQDFSGYNFAGANFSTSGTHAENIFSPNKMMSLDNLVTGTNFKGANFKGATFYEFDMRQALTDAGALDGATQHVNWVDARYSQYADLFKNVTNSIDAARVLYAAPTRSASVN